MAAPPREARFRHGVTVEFEDVDAYGIAHHARLVAYLERARLRLFTALGLDLATQRVVPVVSELRMKFSRPARLGDELEVGMWAREVTELKAVLGYELRLKEAGEAAEDDAVVATAVVTLAFTDLDEGGLQPLPEHFAGRLQRYFTTGTDL